MPERARENVFVDNRHHEIHKQDGERNDFRAVVAAQHRRDDAQRYEVNHVAPRRVRRGDVVGRHKYRAQHKPARKYRRQKPCEIKALYSHGEKPRDGYVNDRPPDVDNPADDEIQSADDERQRACFAYAARHRAEKQLHVCGGKLAVHKQRAERRGASHDDIGKGAVSRDDRFDKTVCRHYAETEKHKHTPRYGRVDDVSARTAEQHFYYPHGKEIGYKRNIPVNKRRHVHADEHARHYRREIEFGGKLPEIFAHERHFPDKFRRERADDGNNHGDESIEPEKHYAHHRGRQQRYADVNHYALCRPWRLYVRRAAEYQFFHITSFSP